MRKLLRNTGGAAAVEFALAALPLITFVFGIMQLAWIVWANNLLNIAVDTAARCGAVQSTTPPCNGSDMISTANRVFTPINGASFTANTCSGVGLVGTYTVTILFIADLTVTAKSCYPTVS
jgi:Flp pilus assembly protein TadG